MTLLTPARFDVSRADSALIDLIVERAFTTAPKGVKLGARINLHMDLAACHRNGNKLELARLLGADDFNFWHDVLGIGRHINRVTGALEDCFLPRFSSPKRKVKGRTSRADQTYIDSPIVQARMRKART